jgi:3-oxoacyl-ACP reductase-like protein
MTLNSKTTRIDKHFSVFKLFHLGTTKKQNMSPQLLKGKTAIVTGSSKLNGIGAASAIALAEQGANVRLLSTSFKTRNH